MHAYLSDGSYIDIICINLDLKSSYYFCSCIGLNLHGIVENT